MRKILTFICLIQGVCFAQTNNDSMIAVIETSIHKCQTLFGEPIDYYELQGCYVGVAEAQSSYASEKDFGSANTFANGACKKNSNLWAPRMKNSCVIGVSIFFSYISGI